MIQKIEQGDDAEKYMAGIQGPRDMSYRKVVCEGATVAVFGYVTVMPGVGHCWVITASTVPRYVVAIIRGAQPRLI